MLLTTLLGAGSGGGGAAIAAIVAGLPTFDLKSELPRLHVVHRRASGYVTGTGGALLSQEHDTQRRKSRTYVVDVRRASPLEWRRLEQLWGETGEGTLPMNYPGAVHGHPEGDVVVVFDDPSLVLQVASARRGTFSITLREFFGIGAS